MSFTDDAGQTRVPRAVAGDQGTTLWVIRALLIHSAEGRFGNCIGDKANASIGKVGGCVAHRNVTNMFGRASEIASKDGGEIYTDQKDDDRVREKGSKR